MHYGYSIPESTYLSLCPNQAYLCAKTVGPSLTECLNSYFVLVSGHQRHLRDAQRQRDRRTEVKRGPPEVGAGPRPEDHLRHQRHGDTLERAAEPREAAGTHPGEAGCNSLSYHQIFSLLLLFGLFVLVVVPAVQPRPEAGQPGAQVRGAVLADAAGNPRQPGQTTSTRQRRGTQEQTPVLSHGGEFFMA